MKWKGLPRSENSWVSEDDLNCDEILEHFEKSQQEETGRRDRSKKSSKTDQSPSKSYEKRDNDEFKNLLELPFGTWENKIASVEHVSEPEDGDLVIHVRMYYICITE